MKADDDGSAKMLLVDSAETFITVDLNRNRKRQKSYPGSLWKHD